MGRDDSPVEKFKHHRLPGPVLQNPARDQAQKFSGPVTPISRQQEVAAGIEQGVLQRIIEARGLFGLNRQRRKHGKDKDVFGTGVIYAVNLPG